MNKTKQRQKSITEKAIEMKNSKIMAGVLGVFLIASLSGCALFNRATISCNRTTTIGQELVDLQDAKERGVISEEEYNRLKKDIMRGGPAMSGGCSKVLYSE